MEARSSFLDSGWNLLPNPGDNRGGWELTGIEAAAYTFLLDCRAGLAFQAHKSSSSPLAKGGCK